MVVIAIVMVLAAIAIPAMHDMQLRAKLAELPSNADGIRTAEHAYNAAHDDWLDTPFQPSGPFGKTTQPWPSDPDWNALGWAPDGEVRGGYGVTATPPSNCAFGTCCRGCNFSADIFCVTAQADIDDDNTNALFYATHDQAPTQFWPNCDEY